jgi:signal transduction histidine kinase
MPIRVRDAIALLIAVGTTVVSLLAWSNGTVTLGLRLAEAGGQVVIGEVTADGNAAWSGMTTGMRVLDVSTVDGSSVRRGDTLRSEIDGLLQPGHTYHWYDQGWESVDGRVSMIGPNHRPPTEVVAAYRIQTLLTGEVSPDVPEPMVWGLLDRGLLELELRSSVWVMGFGAALGALVWGLLRHGAAGRVGREHAVVLGCAAAAPFLVLPIVEVGTTAGIIAGFTVPAAFAFIVGLSLAREHPDPSWRQTATVGALIATGLALLLLVRYLASPTLVTHDRGGVLLMVAGIAVIPALVAATIGGQTVRQRLGLLSLALVPGAAQTLIGQRIDVFAPTVLVGLLVGWQVLPVERVFPDIERRLSGVGDGVPAISARAIGHISARTRDLAVGAIFVLIVLGAMLGAYHTWSVIAGLGLAALVWFAVRQGFLGPAWSDASLPLATAVGAPVVLTAFGSLSDNGAQPWILALTATAALGVSHLLAARYPRPKRGEQLWWASAAVVPWVWLVAQFVAPAPALLLTGCVALVPGIPLAFARSADDASGVSNRLETMAVALTPAAVATTLVNGGGILIFGAWLVALIIWKYATIAPLLRFAQRTQLQRDLAVAAAETERARLAADLHDDALQQLTMLVRKLDERGDAEGAAEAREVADKLRAVVGDLRLPILDDLGAGAALEWLVERVEPLAGGPVKLERSDEARPPATVELAVFRVAQEAITNAIKHGRPPIAIRYDVRADGRVTLAIDDAGEGIGSEAAEEAPRQGHFGLANMQQRAEQIGALLDVRRWPGGGTRVALEWRPQ